MSAVYRTRSGRTPAAMPVINAPTSSMPAITETRSTASADETPEPTASSPRSPAKSEQAKHAKVRDEVGPAACTCFLLAHFTVCHHLVTRKLISWLSHK